MSNIHNVIFLDQVDSTNRFATDLLSKINPKEGTVIRADFQTDGKGQIGRGWHSSPELNLLISIIYYPEFVRIEDQFNISMMTAVSILQVLEDLNIKGVTIKWPNDIYIRDKKVAGILIQNQLQGKSIKSCVIGLGINVNQVFWPDVIPNPTSLLHELQTEIEVNDIFFKVREKITSNYKLLKNNDHFSIIKEQYLTNLFRRNELSSFQDADGNIFEAIIVKVNRSGELVLDRDGEIMSVKMHDIKYIM